MIGILFATEMEARPFLERDAPVGTVMVISGMGMEAALAATEKLILEHGCSFVINAGVCGALNDALERWSIHQIASVVSEELNVIHLQDEGLRLVSVEKPVFQLERKAALSVHAELVDMEGYAVASVCKEHGVRCVLIKGITDFGDHKGKMDIRAHIDAVSESVAEAVIEIVDGASCSVVHPKKCRESITKQDAPSTFKKLHSFTKVEHTIFSLPLLFAGVWLGAGGMPSIRVLLLIALVGLGARTFGMAMNRILDRKIDARNPRTQNRELPSGKLTLGQGIAVAGVGVVLYFVGCALLGSTVIKLSLVPLVPLTLYSLLKRFTPLCHYGIGFCLALAPLGAFVAVTNGLNFSSEVWLLALFTFCWMSGFDIIYALLDIDFDRADGVRSIPAALGPRGAQITAAITHAVALAALVLLWSRGGGAAALAALVVSSVAFVSAYLQRIPVHVRFFPISAIAGIAGALVVLLG
ncbi:MAG: UbiA family prenyltransferase [Pontiellaceae bacterium]|nr:UbiA family prenyltransferase [Pontiellaceae bacterium]